MKNWPPKISIIMGSDSDLPVMKKACTVCDEFGVGYEMRVISAHRNPKDIMEYAGNVHNRGIKVVIAGAGGAAHLPGVIAGNTPLPVVGIPINTKVNGLDSLLSIVQMPPGVPVASVAIDGAKNAALLAMQVLATGDDSMMQKYIEYKKKTAEESSAKNNNPEFTELYKP